MFFAIRLFLLIILHFFERKMASRYILIAISDSSIYILVSKVLFILFRITPETIIATIAIAMLVILF